MYSHGITFGGHPVACAVALKNIEIMKRDGIVSGVLEHEDAFRTTLEQLLDLPIVGDVRGAGFFYAIELVKDKETRETFSDDECETLLRGFLTPALFDAGLICRADDRGDPVIQISPPLVARQAGVRRIVSDPRGRAERGVEPVAPGRRDDFVTGGTQPRVDAYAGAVRRVAVVLAFVVLGASPASAHSPPGRVAFVQVRGVHSSIWVMNAFGTGLRRLVAGSSPAWSLTGTRIAFVREGAVWVMQGDGSRRGGLFAAHSPRGPLTARGWCSPARARSGSWVPTVTACAGWPPVARQRGHRMRRRSRSSALGRSGRCPLWAGGRAS